MAMRALTPLGLFALALAIRLLPWPTVMESRWVVFFGMDAWYHMRRIRLALANGGWPPAFDPYLNFPHGAQPIWPPLFDGLVTWMVWPVHVLLGIEAVERAVVLVPPVLGAVCIVVIYRVGLRLFDDAVAVATGLLLSGLSAHYWYSQVGFLDHHVAVALAATGLLAVTIRILEAPTRPLFAAAGALAGVSLLLWPGMLLHVGLAELGLWCWCVSREDRADALDVAGGLALLNGVALAVVLPSGASATWQGWSDFSPAVISYFQPWMLAALAVHAAGCKVLWSRSGAGRNTRVIHVLAIGVGLLVTSAIVFPELLAGLDEARQWLTKDEVFQGLVNESKPLFVAESGLDVANAERRLSRFLYLLPLALAALVHHAWRSPRRVELLFLAFWVLALAAVTLLQRRFFNSLSPGFALVLAWSGVHLWRARPEPLRTNGLLRVVAAVAGCAVLAVGLAPMLATYRTPLRNLVDTATGSRMTVPKVEFSRRMLMVAAVWLRDNTPPPAAPLDPAAVPEYGVLAPWGYGHLLKYVAQRPTVVGNFGDDVGEANLRRTSAYFASREPDAVRILDDLRARYVLLRTLGDVPEARLRGEAMRKRLSVDDSPGLAHHRLLYESLLYGESLEIGRSDYRVFERVEGARIVGRAPPGTEVRASLAYESNRGRRGLYRSRTVADDGGRYELRVPYASRGGPPGVRPGGPYRIASEGGATNLVVDERAVRAGDVISGPEFPLR